MALTMSQKQALDKLCKRDGTITTEIIIQAARKPTSPLHNAFNWNVEEAAHEHWTQIARRLLREYKLVVTVTDMTATFHPPAYVRDPNMAGDEPGYKTTVSIRNSKTESKKALIEKAETTLGHLTTLRDLCVYWAFDAELIESAMININDFIQAMQISTSRTSSNRRRLEDQTITME